MPSSVSLGPNLGLNYAQIEPSNSRGSSLGSGDSSSLESRPEINPVQSSGISDRVEEELSQLWDSGQEWILIFDNLLKHPGGKASKGCKCDICQRSKNDDTYSKSQKMFFLYFQKKKNMSKIFLINCNIYFVSFVIEVTPIFTKV